MLAGRNPQAQPGRLSARARLRSAQVTGKFGSGLGLEGCLPGRHVRPAQGLAKVGAERTDLRRVGASAWPLLALGASEGSAADEGDLGDGVGGHVALRDEEGPSSVARITCTRR